MRSQDFYRDYRQRYVCDGTTPALASTSQNATRNNFIEAVKNRVKDVRLLRYQKYDLIYFVNYPRKNLAC